MTRYLVTGCGGFLGSHICAEFLAAGHHVIGVDSFATELYPSAPKIARVAVLQSDPGFEFVHHDLRDVSIAPHLDGVTAVLHFAALAGLLPGARYAAAYQEHNVTATRQVLEAIAGTGIHLVHASTSSVYGSKAVGDESTPIAPISAYGRSKADAERVIADYHAEGAITATVLRLFSAYGPGQRPDMAYAVACLAMLRGEPMTIYGDGSQTRSNTYVTDVARAATLSAELRPHVTMNIAGGQPIRLIDALAILGSELGVEPRFDFLPSRPGDQVASQGNTSLARTVLGWSPTVDIRTGLSSQASWFREHWGAEAREGTVHD